MKLEMNKKNIVFVVCCVVVLLVLLILILFDDNKDNSLSNTAKEIDKDVFYEEKTLEFIGDLEPTDNYCKGIRKTVSLSKKNDSDFVATISMKINNVDKKILESPDVYWGLTIGDASNCSGKLEASANYGTFIGRNNGDEVILFQDFNILKDEQEYNLWIWMNKNGKNIGEISKKNIDIDILINKKE